MSTDKADEQEAPGVRASKTDDEDAEGHSRFILANSESDDQEDDTEGHSSMGMGSDPDFGSRAPSVRTSATADEDETEGHI